MRDGTSQIHSVSAVIDVFFSKQTSYLVKLKEIYVNDDKAKGCDFCFDVFRSSVLFDIMLVK